MYGSSYLDPQALLPYVSSVSPQSRALPLTTRYGVGSTTPARSSLSSSYLSQLPLRSSSTALTRAPQTWSAPAYLPMPKPWVAPQRNVGDVATAVPSGNSGYYGGEEWEQGDEVEDTASAAAQTARNAVAILERMFESKDFSELSFVQHTGVKRLIKTFGDLEIPTQVRLTLLVQSFIAQIQLQTDKKILTSLGTSFESAFNELRNNFIQSATDNGLPIAGAGSNGKLTIVGLFADELFEAYIQERRSCHALFNLWKAYISAQSMSPKFFNSLHEIFSQQQLPGRAYCLAANALIKRVAVDLERLNTTLQRGDSDQETLYTSAEIANLLDLLAGLEGHFDDVLDGSDSPITLSEVSKRIEKIEADLQAVEDSAAEFATASNKKYMLGTRLGVLADIEELMLRGYSINDRLAGVIERVLKLHGTEAGPHFQNEREPAYGAFFVATVDFLFFIDCFTAALPKGASTLIPAKSKSVVDRLKAQYKAWNAALFVKPQSPADFVMAKRTNPVFDMYSKQPSDYKDVDGRVVAIDRLFACMPYVATGMGVDAKDAKGLRVYRQPNPAEVPGDSWLFADPSDFDASALYAPAQKKTEGALLLTDGAVSTAASSGASDSVAPLDLRGKSLSEIEDYSAQLMANAERWMVQIKLSTFKPDYQAAAFGVAAAWLRTMIVLDEALYVNGKKPTPDAIQVKWKKLMKLLQGFMGAQGSTFLGIWSKTEAQGYVSQVLGDLARTHAYDSLSFDLKETIQELFRKASNRAKADPAFSDNLRYADGLELVSRIKGALTLGFGASLKDVTHIEASSDKAVRKIKEVAAIATLSALFDPEKSIVADDLFPEDAPGKKRLIVTVLMQAGDLYSKIEDLVQLVPKSDLDSCDIQVLKAWNGFLDLFFSDGVKASPFFIRFSTENTRLSTGINDLTSRRKKINTEIAKRRDLSDGAVVMPFAFKVRSSEELKIKALELNIAFARAWRERDLKKMIVDLELRIASSLKSDSVFLYDESFLLKKSYSLGEYQASKTKAALVILRGILRLLQAPQFLIPNAIGYAVAAHLLPALNKIAEKHGDDMDKAESGGVDMMRLFYSAVLTLKPLLPDVSSVLPETNQVFNKCAAKVGTKPSLDDVLKPFDAAHQDIVALLDGKALDGSALPPLVQSGSATAIAMNMDYSSALLG